LLKGRLVRKCRFGGLLEGEIEERTGECGEYPSTHLA